MPSDDTWSSIAPLKQSSYFSKRRSWVNTPNFVSLPKEDRPNNAMSGTYTKFTQKSRTASGYTPPGGSFVPVSGPGYLVDGTWIESFSSTFNNLLLQETEAERNSIVNQQLVRLYGRVAERKADIGVTLRESRKTSDMILNAANRIDRSYRAFRRGQFRKVAKILSLTPGTIHKNWLEYKYGWMPLLMETKNAAEFFAQQTVGRPDRFTVRDRIEYNASKTRTTSYGAYGGGANGTYTETTRLKVLNLRVLRLEITNPAVSQLQQLGLTNPASVAWELIPFSFVFDWFISVGDYLVGLTAFHGINIRSAVLSSQAEWDYAYTQPSTTRESGGTTYFNADFEFTAPARFYSRGTFDVSPGSIYPPRNNGINSFSRLVTSLALIKGNYRGSTRI